VVATKINGGVESTVSEAEPATDDATQRVRELADQHGSVGGLVRYPASPLLCSTSR
jgi:hypothetical protein